MLAKEWSYLDLTTVWLNQTHVPEVQLPFMHMYTAVPSCGMTTSELPNHPESTSVGLDFLVAE